MINRQTHHFTEGKVITGMCPNGEYGAYREDEDEGRIRGYGHTRLAAIADLNEAVGTDEPEEVDHQAARFDHAHDHRKNWVA